MKWFNNWFSKKCLQAINQPAVLNPNSTVRGDFDTSSLRAEGLNFTFYSANGGYVVEYHKYNQITDRNEHNLYVITKDKDLGEELAHIITYEIIRK